LYIVFERSSTNINSNSGPQVPDFSKPRGMNHIPSFIAGGLIPEALRGHAGRPQIWRHMSNVDPLTLQVPRKMM